jgi:hypothetical protein
LLVVAVVVIVTVVAVVLEGIVARYQMSYLVEISQQKANYHLQ